MASHRLHTVRSSRVASACTGVSPSTTSTVFDGFNCTCNSSCRAQFHLFSFIQKKCFNFEARLKKKPWLQGCPVSEPRTLHRLKEKNIEFAPKKPDRLSPSTYLFRSAGMEKSWLKKTPQSQSKWPTKYEHPGQQKATIKWVRKLIDATAVGGGEAGPQSI